MSHAIAALLVGLGVISRLLPHPPNAVAMGAVALYAGARLPRRWAFLVPLTAMVLSDLALDWGRGLTFFHPVRMASYATFIAIVGLSSLARGSVNVLERVGMSVGASTLFFVTTNFAVWAWPEGHASGAYAFPQTFEGLLACYSAAIPFYGNSLAADLIGTATLFGLDALAFWVAQGARPKKLAEIPLDVQVR
jgi:hypothetical protein